MPIQTEGFFENKAVTSNSNFLFLKTGITRLRLIPAYNAGGDWFREIAEIPLQQNGKYSPVVSPQSVGDPCPFAREVRRLKQAGGEANLALADQFRPRWSFLFNVVVFETPDGPVPIQECLKIMKCGVKVKRQLMEINSDVAGGWGDITNLTSGVDLTISRTGSGRTDTEYHVSPWPRVAGQTRSNILEYLEQKGWQGTFRPHNLDETFQPKTFDELEVLLKNQLVELAPRQDEVIQPQTTSPNGGVSFEIPPQAPVEGGSVDTPETPAFPFGNQGQ
jgi:hypothetical protein